MSHRFPILRGVCHGTSWEPHLLLKAPSLVPLQKPRSARYEIPATGRFTLAFLLELNLLRLRGRQSLGFSSHAPQPAKNKYIVTDHNNQANYINFTDLTNLTDREIYNYTTTYIPNVGPLSWVSRDQVEGFYVSPANVSQFAIRTEITDLPTERKFQIRTPPKNGYCPNFTILIISYFVSKIKWIGTKKI